MGRRSEACVVSREDQFPLSADAASPASSEVPVRKGQKLEPVPVGDGVPARTDVVGEDVSGGLVDLRHAIGVQTAGAEQAVDGLDGLGG